MAKKVKGSKKGGTHSSFWCVIEAAYTDDEGLKPMKYDGVPFKVKGNIGRALHIEVAANITQQQADRVSKAVMEAHGHEPLVLTSNVKLIRFRRVSEEQARALVLEGEAKRKGEQPLADGALEAAEAELKAMQAAGSTTEATVSTEHAAATEDEAPVPEDVLAESKS